MNCVTEMKLVKALFLRKKKCQKAQSFAISVVVRDIINVNDILG